MFTYDFFAQNRQEPLDWVPLMAYTPLSLIS